LETWQILIYAGGAVGGGLAGMIFTAFLYYMVCRHILRDPRSMSSVLHTVFANRFNKTAMVYSTAQPDNTRPVIVGTGEPFKETASTRLKQVTVSEEGLAPVQTISSRSPHTAEVRENNIPVQMYIKPTVPRIEEQDIPATSAAERLREVSINEEHHAPVRIFAESNRPDPINDGDLNEIMAELLTEIYHNYKIVREFSGDTLVSLQTSIWDSNRRVVKTLPETLQNELESMYGTIKMLNNVVWFSTEFQRHSSALTEQYTNLLTLIDCSIKQLVENPMFRDRHLKVAEPV